MSVEPTFSPRLLVIWIVGAAAAFALALYLMGSGPMGSPDTIGPSTYSRSAIGYAGIAEVLTRLNIATVKSRSNSLDKLTAGGVLVIAEPLQSAQTEALIRPLLNAKAVLLVLPKWNGFPSQTKTGWVQEVAERPLGDAQWALKLVAPNAEVMRGSFPIKWSTNALKTDPDLDLPLRFMRGDRLRPIIGGQEGILLGEISDKDRKVWVLSDPDIISNHGIANPDNAALAVAIIAGLRGNDGNVVFDETVHGFVVRPSTPSMLLFRFPFVVATVQGLIAVALLLWATLGRFGAPRTAPPSLSAGREGLLQNMAKLVEFTGHQDVMVKRYVEETVRETAMTLHAPRELSGKDLIAWLKRVGLARGATIDFEALLRVGETGETGETGEPNAGRRSPSALLKLARDIHQWKGEIVDGRGRHPGGH